MWLPLRPAPEEDEEEEEGEDGVDSSCDGRVHALHRQISISDFQCGARRLAPCVSIACFLVNFCCGAAVGRFIWPRSCPCAACNLLCYGPGLWLRPWSFLMPCPCPFSSGGIGVCCIFDWGFCVLQERLDSLTFLIQRMAVAGTAALPQLYPFPPGSFDVPVTQDDAYRGTQSPPSTPSTHPASSPPPNS